MAFDWDAVIVGGGPAGLTAGEHLARAGHRVTVLERDLFGGALQHTDRIEDDPSFPDGITGAQLAAHMVEQATASGAVLEQADVSGVEVFSRSRWVACSDGRGFSCGVVILAGGTHYVKLGVPNEERFRGRGVVDCTPCDGGFFVDRDVLIYGASDYALRDARYLAELGCRVTLVAPDAQPGAAAWTHERLAFRGGARLLDIQGSDRVESVTLQDAHDGSQEQMAVQGVLVRVGTAPTTDYLAEFIDLDPSGYVLTNQQLDTSAQFVLACGEIRAGVPSTVAAAVADGADAAARAMTLFPTLA